MRDREFPYTRAARRLRRSPHSSRYAMPLTSVPSPDRFTAMFAPRPHHHTHLHHGLTGRGDARVHG